MDIVTNAFVRTDVNIYVLILTLLPTQQKESPFPVVSGK